MRHQFEIGHCANGVRERRLNRLHSQRIGNLQRVWRTLIHPMQRIRIFVFFFRSIRRKCLLRAYQLVWSICTTRLLNTILACTSRQTVMGRLCSAIMPEMRFTQFPRIQSKRWIGEIFHSKLNQSWKSLFQFEWEADCGSKTALAHHRRYQRNGWRCHFRYVFGRSDSASERMGCQGLVWYVRGSAESPEKDFRRRSKCYHHCRCGEDMRYAGRFARRNWQSGCEISTRPIVRASLRHRRYCTRLRRSCPKRGSLPPRPHYRRN